MTNIANQDMSKSHTSLLAQINHYEADFIKFIAQHLGITTSSKSQILHNLIISACQKFACQPDEYLNNLLTCEPNSPIIDHLINGITIGETYFFRDAQQVQLLRYQLLPTIIQKKQQQHHRVLRIWSAGCSTGEEIYTIAIMLSELLPDINRWTIQLLGTDINNFSLQKAQQGYYNKWSMRSISPHHQQQYFIQTNNQYRLSTKILNKVNFQYLNLKEDNYPSSRNNTQLQDLIICRNVLIYFDMESVQQLMRKISLSLSDGGYLLLGASDPVFIHNTTLVPQPNQGMLFLRQDSKTTPPSFINTSHQILTKQTPMSAHKTFQRTSVDINKQESDVKSTVINALKSDSDKLCLQAQKAADAGQLEQAIANCSKSIALDATNKDAYFILALVFIELNRLQEAEIALKKALYIDHKFIEGHFQLGLLLLKNKHDKTGLKRLKNALLIVNKHKPADIVPGSQGLSYQRFATIIEKEIERYTNSS